MVYFESLSKTGLVECDFYCCFCFLLLAFQWTLWEKQERWIQLSILICYTYAHLNLFHNRLEATEQNNLDLHFFLEKTDSKGKKE